MVIVFWAHLFSYNNMFLGNLSTHILNVAVLHVHLIGEVFWGVGMRTANINHLRSVNHYLTMILS